MDWQEMNKDRLLQEFTELIQIDSVSYGERKMADRLKEKLSGMGFLVEEDNAGEACGSDTGNVFGYLKGSLPGKPILLCAHMDTVEPGLGKKAVPGEDRITSDGTTVLGADDVCGLVEILEGIRYLEENGIPHRDVEVLFPIAEELFLKGTNAFDFSRIKAEEAYVLDLSGPVGAAALQAPTLISFTIVVNGKASHAGFAPEEGIHAIGLAAKAIDRLPMGRIGEDTTLNIGRIEGGAMVNIVPEACVCEGEIRSYSHEKALQVLDQVWDIFDAAVQGTGASLDLDYQVDFTAYQIEKEENVVRRFQEVCEKLSIPASLTKTFGGSDNHNFVLHGIRGIVLSCGMYQCHGTSEYTTPEDLQKGAAVIAGLLTQEG